MTTLTPNRILQQGDEYRNNGTWKPVPKEDYGLQVMFTKYPEVRRPDEEPPKETTTVNLPNIGRTVEVLTPQAVTSRNLAKRVAEVEAEPISPVSEKPKAVKPSAIVTATAEKETTPAPTPSGAGEPHPSSYLPTIISKKAHQDAIEHPEFVGHVPSETEQAIANASEHLSPAALENFKRHKAAAEEHAKRLLATHKTETEKAAEAAKVIAERCDAIKIDFPKISAGCGDTPSPSIWTGRNGTFTGYALEAHVLNGNITLTPHGKRGSGNCRIQFPQSVIPQLVDWLLRQQKTTPI